MAIKMSRRARWAVPATGVAVTAAVVAGLQIPSAQASPTLPARTPAQLLAQVSSDASLPPLTGTMVESTSLGLPQLPQVGNATSLTSLLTGSHTLKIYYQNAKEFRVAIPQPESEIDLIRNGSTAWLWNSTENSVTKFNLPANGKGRSRRLSRSSRRSPPSRPPTSCSSRSARPPWSRSRPTSWWRASPATSSSSPPRTTARWSAR